MRRRMSREERELYIEFGGDRAARLEVEGEYRCMHCGSPDCDEATCADRPRRLKRKAPAPTVTAQPKERPARVDPDSVTREDVS